MVKYDFKNFNEENDLEASTDDCEGMSFPVAHFEVFMS